MESKPSKNDDINNIELELSSNENNNENPTIQQQEIQMVGHFQQQNGSLQSSITNVDDSPNILSPLSNGNNNSNLKPTSPIKDPILHKLDRKPDLTYDLEHQSINLLLNRGNSNINTLPNEDAKERNNSIKSNSLEKRDDSSLSNEESEEESEMLKRVKK